MEEGTIFDDFNNQKNQKQENNDKLKQNKNELKITIEDLQ